MANKLVALALIVLALLLTRLAWRQFARWRFDDPVIDRLIKPPVDRGFGEHDEAQERAARERRERARSIGLDAARTRLPRRMVFLDERAVSQFRSRRS